MIQQKAKGLNSRLEAIPYLEDGFLPLITAPMYSVVDQNNYQTFLDNKVHICLPRGQGYDGELYDMRKGVTFTSVSLQDFIKIFIDEHDPIDWPYGQQICIDTANGNMPQLHDAIREAKEIHGDNLIIMAGNVSSVEAFIELAKTGVDYIRVGIGGGSGCNTTNNTGVGQEDLGDLIKKCLQIKSCILWPIYDKSLNILFDGDVNDRQQVSKVKIVADGISSYIKLCQQKYNFNDNGYAAIIKLLNSGADLVMVGGLFAQCVESAGEKRTDLNITLESQADKEYALRSGDLRVKISGMSTIEEQQKYKDVSIHDHLSDKLISTKELETPLSKNVNLYGLKPSEGSTKWLPVRWTLNEWLNGSSKQDEYPYLNGFINSLKSAMSYTGSKILNEFKS